MDAVKCLSCGVHLCLALGPWGTEQLSFLVKPTPVSCPAALLYCPKSVSNFDKTLIVLEGSVALPHRPA